MNGLGIDHVRSPRNRGRLKNATHYGESGSPGGGPYVCIWLRIEDGVIVRATYETPGCPSSVAAASVLCQLVTGRETEKAALLTESDLMVILGGLPEGKEHYAAKAVQALNLAIETRVSAVS